MRDSKNVKHEVVIRAQKGLELLKDKMKSDVVREESSQVRNSGVLKVT